MKVLTLHGLSGILKVHALHIYIGCIWLSSEIKDISSMLCRNIFFVRILLSSELNDYHHYLCCISLRGPILTR